MKISWCNSGNLVRKMTWKTYASLALIYCIAWFSGQNLSFAGLFFNTASSLKGGSDAAYTEIIKSALKSADPDLEEKLRVAKEVFGEQKQKLGSIIEQHLGPVFLFIALIIALTAYALVWQFRFLLLFFSTLFTAGIERRLLDEFKKKGSFAALVFASALLFFFLPAAYLAASGILQVMFDSSGFGAPGAQAVRFSNLLALLGNVCLGLFFFFLIPWLATRDLSVSLCCRTFLIFFCEKWSAIMRYLLCKGILTTVLAYFYAKAVLIIVIAVGLPLSLIVILLSVLLFMLTFSIQILLYPATFLFALLLICLALAVTYAVIFIFLRMFIFLTYMDLNFLRFRGMLDQEKEACLMQFDGKVILNQ